jgi:hypothetical protein
MNGSNGKEWGLNFEGNSSPNYDPSFEGEARDNFFNVQNSGNAGGLSWGSNVAWVCDWANANNTLSFDCGGGGGGIGARQGQVGRTETLPDYHGCSRPGFKFTGWNLGGPGAGVYMDSDKTAVAQWQGKPGPGAGGTTSTASSNSGSTDYKDKSLTFSHSVNVGTYISECNPPAEREGGCRTEGTRANAWSVSNSGLSGAPAASGNQGGNGNTQVYSRTHSLTSDNVRRQWCSSISATPQSAQISVEDASPIGWNVVTRYTGTASSNTCADVYSSWVTSAATTLTEPQASTGCRNGSGDKTKPGCDITFSHVVKESSGHVVKNDDGGWVTVRYRVQTSRDGGASWDDPGWTNGAAQVGENANIWTGDTRLTINVSDSGKTVCQRAVADYQGRNNQTERQAAAACIQVPYNYNLVPSIVAFGTDNTGGDTVQHGQFISGISGTIYNRTQDSGTTLGEYATDSVRSNFRIVRFVARPNGNTFDRPDDYPGGFQDAPAPDSDGYACDYWQSRVASMGGEWQNGGCGSFADGANGPTNVIGGNLTGDGSQFVTNSLDFLVPDDMPMGYNLCFAISIRNNITYQLGNNTNDGWARHSRPVCYRVGKAPKIQICNAGVSAPGGVQGKVTDRSHATSNQGVFGSWAEYEAVSASTISGFGTAAAFHHPAPGSGLADASHPIEYNSLSIGNIAKEDSSNDDTSFGFFEDQHSSNTYRAAAYFENIAKAAATPSSTVDTALNGEDPLGAYYGTGKVTIGSAGGEVTVRQGHTAIVVTEGDVYIAGNIRYADSTYTKAEDIPQTIIVSHGTIRINADVTRIDAWLIASGPEVDDSDPNDHPGTIMTCANDGEAYGTVVDRISSNVCNKKLVINGPIYADKLHLFRTAGAEASDPKKPAEVFTLPNITYLWSLNYAKEQNHNYALSVFSKDLPPRY